MNVLYVVSESDADAEFYALCVQRLCGEAPRLVLLRNSKNQDVTAVTATLDLGLKQAVKAAGSTRQAGFIGAMDNDRAPHPENAGGLQRERLTPPEQQREDRRKWMLEVVTDWLGKHRAAWPLPVALAVPVEMLESWLVMIFRPEPLQPARHFSWAESPGARDYYHPEPPPPQWKDLCLELQAALGKPDRESFFLYAAERLDAVALAERSASFAEFKAMVEAWGAGPDGGQR